MSEYIHANDLGKHYVITMDGNRRTKRRGLVPQVIGVDALTVFTNPALSFCVLSPEDLFVQMAGEVSLEELVRLGCELCGRYSLLPYGERGFWKREPLTSKGQLERAMRKMKHRWHIQAARRALQYVFDGSRSPMETIVAMLLTLPKRMGGCGFGHCRSVVNMRIDIPPSKRLPGMLSYYEGDLVWPDRRICVEYDSDLHHSSGADINRDSMKRAALRALGYEVVTVTRAQVFNFDAFSILASTLGRSLGSYRRWTDKQRHCRAALRRLLLRA